MLLFITFINKKKFQKESYFIKKKKLLNTNEFRSFTLIGIA